MTRAGHGELSYNVLKFVEAHAGQRVNVEDVQAATGFTIAQVQQAMGRIIKEGRWPVHVIVRGRIWRASERDYIREPARVLGELEKEKGQDAPPPPPIEDSNGRRALQPEPTDPSGKPIQHLPAGVISDKPYVPMGWKRDPHRKGWRLVPDTAEDVPDGPPPTLEVATKPEPEPESNVEDFEIAPSPFAQPKPDPLNDPTTTIYEVLGARHDGKLIIRSHLGDFYLATLEKI